jgi:hypothetical protein
MEPTLYLGDKLRKTVMPNGVVAWGMSSSKYVQSAVKNVQEYLKENGDRKLKKKSYAPFEATYRADIDESMALGPKMAHYCSPTFCVCRVKVTWMLCIECLHTCPCTTMQGWCLTLTILTLICMLSSRPIGSPCTGMSSRQFLQTHLSQEGKQSTYVSLWVLTMQESTLHAARGQVFSFN